MHNLYVYIAKTVNIWQFSVYNLAYTGIWFGQYLWRYISEDLGRFQVEIEDSKGLYAKIRDQE